MARPSDFTARVSVWEMSNRPLAQVMKPPIDTDEHRLDLTFYQCLSVCIGGQFLQGV